MSFLSYSNRAFHTPSFLAKRLFTLLDVKQTNLALSADITSAKELLALADCVGPEICILKTHIDIIEDFNPEFIHTLQALAKKHQFLIFEDRKFADIGNTVKQQFSKGIFHIADWADIINAHALPGPGQIQALQKASNSSQGLVLVAEMSSAGHLLHTSYQEQTLALAQQFSDYVFGFITQHALNYEPQWINLTPGIKLAGRKDQLGQQYITPEQAILKNGTDIIIVGRGIIEAPSPQLEAKKYREAGWEAYQKRISECRNLVKENE